HRPGRRVRSGTTDREPALSGAHGRSSRRGNHRRDGHDRRVGRLLVACLARLVGGSGNGAARGVRAALSASVPKVPRVPLVPNVLVPRSGFQVAGTRTVGTSGTCGTRN